MRTVALSIWAVALLGLPGCASDVVLKPAVAEFNDGARSAIAEVDGRYTQLVTSFNEVTVDWLADHPECGLRTTLRMRTPAADEWLARNARDKRILSSGPCLTNAEWEVLDSASQTGLAEKQPLLILSRADFAAQLATVRALSRYVAALAEAADAPDLKLRDEISATAGTLRGIGGALAAGRTAVSANGTPNSDLFADGGPVDAFVAGVADLAGAIETIVKSERDASSIRAAVLGPQGAAIPEMLASIGRDADRWSCLQFTVDQLSSLLAEQRARDRLANLPRSQRVLVYRKFLASRVAQPQSCGTKDPAGTAPPPSPIGRMLAELAATHEELDRIAQGKYSPRERRQMAVAALSRLSAVFSAIAKTAVVII